LSYELHKNVTQWLNFFSHGLIALVGLGLHYEVPRSQTHHTL
jgi:hypothetical protein